MIHRTATAEEWSALVAKIRKTNPRVADALDAGASFTSDGETLHPPLGHEERADTPLCRIVLPLRATGSERHH